MQAEHSQRPHFDIHLCIQLNIAYNLCKNHREAPTNYTDGPMAY